MKSQVLHAVWCHISGEAAGELLGVKGLTRTNVHWIRSKFAGKTANFSGMIEFEERGLIINQKSRGLGISKRVWKERFNFQMWCTHAIEISSDPPRSKFHVAGLQCITTFHSPPYPSISRLGQKRRFRLHMRFLMRFRVQNAPYPTLHERVFREASRGLERKLSHIISRHPSFQFLLTWRYFVAALRD